jgi:ribosomal protein L21E
VMQEIEGAMGKGALFKLFRGTTGQVETAITGAVKMHFNRG